MRAAAAALGLGAALLAAPAEAACRLALALAMDISSSVNPAEYRIQKDGLVAALRSEEVREALQSQAGEVWLAVYEWSGYQQQDLLIDWTRMDGDAAIDGFAAKLAAHHRLYAEFPTAIGRAVEFGAALLRSTPQPCERLVIDISGDGVNNDGVDQKHHRKAGTLNGITVNALVIDGAFPDPVAYYRERVVDGPGAFMMVARNGFEDYPELIRAKLLREINPAMLLGEVR